MDKALLNFLALICFVGAIVYVLPMYNIDVGATISHLTMQSISLLPSGLQAIGEPITTPRPVPTLINISPWPPGSTPTPTVLPSPTPSTVPSASPPPTPTVTPVPCPTPTPVASPSLVPTEVPEPTATGPVVVPTATVSIVPSPTVVVTITPGPAGSTTVPVAGNITPAPPTVARNVTERAMSPGSLALTVIVILGLLLVAFIAWKVWREKK